MRSSVLLLAFAACGSENLGPDAGAGGSSDARIEPKCSGTQRAFKQDVVPLIGHCGGEICHGGMLQNVPTWPYSSLVGVMTNECNDGRQIVKSGDPANSYLIQKLEGVGMCMGNRMPNLETPMPASDIQTIVDWICAGAPNN